MRKAFLLVLVLQFGLLSAQDWALLNPDYKYNYSNDGTDTIRNQILATHIDVLGPDSFLYVLNKVAKLCPACPEGCNVQVNLPQFMQMDCHVGAGTWRFIDPGEFDLKPTASLNDQWLFDPLIGTVGMLSAITAELVLGEMDSVRTMTTALNDTVRWSRNHGITLWHLHDSARYELLGIQGLQVGSLIPSLTDFFAFQPGDIVQFYASSTSNMHTMTTSTKFHVQGREEGPGHLTFTGYANSLVIEYYGEHIYHYFPEFTWNLDTGSDPKLRPLSSWPGEGVIVHINNPTTTSVDAVLVAKHYRDTTGAYFITGDILNSNSLLTVLDTPSVNCVSVQTQWSGNDLQLDTRLGLRHYSWNALPDQYSFSTLGAVINGDTIGSVYSDEYLHVGIDETKQGSEQIFPVPANDHIVLTKQKGVTGTWDITNLTGQQLASGRLEPLAEQTIDVSRLAAGSYLFILTAKDGRVVRRFIIAR